MHTMLRVPTSTVGGSTLAEIISEMKLLVMPMIAIIDAPCMRRVILNVAPRAPEAAIMKFDGDYLRKVSRIVFN